MRHQPVQTRQIADEALQRVLDAGEGGGVEPKPVQLVYVASSGSDQNGNGSFANPFQTLEHAETSITDATALKPYTILVAPGAYVAPVLKSFISINGIDPSNLPVVSGALALDPGFTTGLGLANLEFSAAQTLAFGVLAAPTADIEHCKFDSTFATTGTGGYTLTLGRNTFVGQATFTDAAFISEEGNTFFGAGAFVANAASGAVDSSSDTFRNNLVVTATAPFVITVVAVGSQTNGALDLTGAGATFRGTAGAIPPVVGLAGGAVAPTLLSSANGMSYIATTVANWSGVNPTSVQNALDRIAAKDTPIP
jgi:hypothetical protein